MQLSFDMCRKGNYFKHAQTVAGLRKPAFTTLLCHWLSLHVFDCLKTSKTEVKVVNEADIKVINFLVAYKVFPTIMTLQTTSAILLVSL